MYLLAAKNHIYICIYICVYIYIFTHSSVDCLDLAAPVPAVPEAFSHSAIVSQSARAALDSAISVDEAVADSVADGNNYGDDGDDDSDHEDAEGRPR